MGAGKLEAQITPDGSGDPDSVSGHGMLYVHTLIGTSMGANVAFQLEEAGKRPTLLGAETVVAVAQAEDRGHGLQEPQRVTVTRKA